MILKTQLPSSPHHGAPRLRQRPLRVARMLAVALRMRDLGETQEEIASLMGCTQARVSQLLNLTLLAPSIQEALLFAEASPGRDWVTEHQLRSVSALLAWEDQAARWREIQAQAPR
jgi:ParB-like chromosome segregation protein Spo0J